MSLLGDVIGNKNPADVASVNQLQALADAVQAVMAWAADTANQTPPSVAQLQALTIKGVTDSKWQAIIDAIRASDNSGSDVSTVAKLQALVYATFSAIERLAFYADQGEPVPTIKDYTDAGISGIGGAGQPTVSTINSVLADADIGSVQANTQDKVQGLVNAYRVILDNANNGAATDATAAQYQVVGVNGIDTTAEVGLLGSVIDGKADTDVATVAQLQILADAVQAVMNGTADKEQLGALGVDVSSITAEKLKAVQNAIGADDPASLSALQQSVNKASNAYSAASDLIASYATRSANTGDPECLVNRLVRRGAAAASIGTDRRQCLRFGVNGRGAGGGATAPASQRSCATQCGCASQKAQAGWRRDDWRQSYHVFSNGRNGCALCWRGTGRYRRTAVDKRCSGLTPRAAPLWRGTLLKVSVKIFQLDNRQVIDGHQQGFTAPGQLLTSGLFATGRVNELVAHAALRFDLARTALGHSRDDCVWCLGSRPLSYLLALIRLPNQYEVHHSPRSVRKKSVRGS